MTMDDDAFSHRHALSYLFIYYNDDVTLLTQKLGPPPMLSWPPTGTIT